MWRIASACHEDQEFLNASTRDTAKWHCETCPDGASCKGPTAWYNDTHNDIRALQGFWRVPWNKTRFEACPYPADCIGAEPGVTLRLAANESSVFEESCLDGTEGVLCTVCQPGYNRNILTCKPCTAASFTLSIFLLLALFASTVAAVTCCHRRLEKSKYSQYRNLWIDVLRIGNVMVTFYQVNSSLPSVIELQWPENFVAFIAVFDWVNIDILSLLGADCIGNFDFRTSFVIMLFLPVSIVVLALVDYKCERRSLAKRLANMSSDDKELYERESLHLLFQLADRDNSGHIDPSELAVILKQLGWTTDLETAKAVMASIPGVRKSSEGYFASLPESAFVASMVAGQVTMLLAKAKIPRKRVRTLVRKKTAMQRASTLLARGEKHKQTLNPSQEKLEVKTLSDSDKLVAWTMRRKHVSNALSGATQLLLLAHTPVSRKVFQYFHFNDIAGKRFLRADYRLLSDSDEWSAFLPVVTIVLLLFTIGLPGLIGKYLWTHSHELYSTSVIQRVGFLYSAYNRGAEFWQLHDVILKSVLTGMLIYVPSNARASVGLLIVMIAIANLNFFKPHRAPEIFWLTQLSFAVMVTKYAVATLLMIMEFSGSPSESVLQLGILLICLDILMLISSVGTIYFLLQSLENKLRKLDADDTNGASNTKRTIVVPISAVPINPALMAEQLAISYEQEIDELHRDHAFHEEALRRQNSKRQVRSNRNTEMRVASRARVRKSKVLHQVDLFSSMSENDINTVLECTNFETFSGGTVICSQGDLATKFYILVTGHCKVSVEQAGGGADTLDVAMLNPMQYFGEGCLEQVTQDRRRMANVIAVESVQLLSLHRADLIKLIEQEVIRCNMIGMMLKTVRQRTMANQSLLAAGKPGP
jgi:CRP-like cAMP-binding protein